MKKLIILTALFALAFTSRAEAQLFRRSCGAYRSCYGSCATGYRGYWTGQYYGGACADGAPTACSAVETQSYAEFTSKPCEPVAPIETRPEPCEACGEYTPIQTDSGLSYRSCPTGACPLQKGTVASLLDRANAVRAQYGLAALSFDSNLEVGSRYQASFCASRGALIHGSGAEILAQNSQGIETALTQWLNSPAHRALLLNPNYRFGGVAVHRDSSGRVWCAMRFR